MSAVTGEVEESDATLRAVPEELRADLGRFVMEGALNTVFSTLIGGVFLVGFALSLGATDSHIGLLAALPLLLNLVQVVGSYVVNRVGSPKLVCLVSAALFRAVWVVILIVPPFIVARGGEGRAITFLLAAFGVACLFASLGGIAWMAWIAPLIPESVRGRAFGHRNMVASAVGMLVALGGGRFIDHWQRVSSEPSGQAYSFSALFAVAALFGVAGWLVLRGISEVPMLREGQQGGFLRGLLQPLRDPGFRRWITFSTCWSFAVGVAGPFFSVFMIRTLHFPFSLIALLGLVSGITSTLGMRLWGSLIDEVGSKPLLLICSLGGGIVPVLWLFATPESYGVLWIAHAFSGLCWSGIGLASFQLLMSAAPKEGSATYFAVFAAVTGLSGAAAPIVGGALTGALGFLEWDVGIVVVGPLHLMFLITAALRIATLSLLRSVPVARDMPPAEVLTKLGSMSSYQLMRSGQQVAAVSITSLENTLTHISAGSLEMESRVARALERGAEVASKVREGFEEVDERVEKGLNRWERILDALIGPIVAMVRVILSFLSEEDDHEDSGDGD